MKQLKQTVTVDSVEASLAQTQCRLCEYDDCRSYAEAIVAQETPINRCLPGGETTLRHLADLTQEDLTASQLADMRHQTKALTLAVIREEECIGCTKCLAACPVDAIIGSGQQMHTVLTEACNGCERCLPVCPVDCIDTIPHPLHEQALDMAQQSKERYARRQARLARNKLENHKRRHETKQQWKENNQTTRKKTIQAILSRARHSSTNPHPSSK